MVRYARKERSAEIRVGVLDSNGPDDTGEFLSPLTSGGADAVRVVRLNLDGRQSRSAYPNVPQTLREAETRDRRCAGMVAEPMS